MYYDLKFVIQDRYISENEARERISKIIALQGNTKNRQLDLKLLSGLKLEHIKNGTSKREMMLRFDVSDKLIIRLKKINGIILSEYKPTGTENKENAKQYDEKFYSIKGILR
jgi:hypothetical protein